MNGIFRRFCFFAVWQHGASPPEHPGFNRKALSFVLLFSNLKVTLEANGNHNNRHKLYQMIPSCSEPACGFFNPATILFCCIILVLVVCGQGGCWFGCTGRFGLLNTNL